MTVCRSFRVMGWMEWRVLYLQTGGLLGGGGVLVSD